MAEVKETHPEKIESCQNLEDREANCDDVDCDSIVDISSKSLDFSLVKSPVDSIQGLYIYRNSFNLIPRWLGDLGKLKTLKFFGNEVNLFPAEMKNLVELERLQVKVSSPRLSGLYLNNMKDLKELELCKVPARSSIFPLLSEIAGLKSLTKLSVCHFSIRYLPLEIGFLESLEYLDLSFNKMRNLPTEITYLTALISLKVTNNKLVELPSGFSSLQRLEFLDLSNNRLSSLESLELSSMHNLRTLNLQNNKITACRQIPSWICCNLEGNNEDECFDECISVAVEMDVLEGDVQENIDRASQKAHTSSHSSGISSVSRCNVARKTRKGWKRRYDIQQRARQERLNNRRKWKASEHAKSPRVHKSESCEQLGDELGLSAADNNVDNFVTEESKCEVISVDDDGIINPERVGHVENCSCSNFSSDNVCEEDENNCKEGHESSAQVKSLCDNSPHSKRPHDNEVDEQPTKRRLISDQSDLAFKYSDTSFCSIDDHLGDGFYDAGRDRPFLPLENYEKSLHIDSREVILLDKRKDEGLNVITHCAQALVNHFKQINDSMDKLQVASLLALFVSDHFGGRDKTSMVEKTNRAASGSNYQKPFICTCPTGNGDSINNSSPEQSSRAVEDIVIRDLCERSLQAVKARIKSIVVPIGTLQFGVCRHRALLMKYLCDRVKPHVPCELVRGYLDFSPHAWNVVVVKRGDSWVRMIVDACHPYEMREETDPKYFFRYVPLSRIYFPGVSGGSPESISFPSLSSCNEIEKEGISTLVRCDVGSIEAVAKVRTLEAGGPMEEVKNFEYRCLGEVRILNAVKKHPCIVDIYGHRISSKWVQSSDGESPHRIMQSAILMEYIKGGSLKKYIEKLQRDGEKHVRGGLALQIARDVASALAELHSKHIIHRDIKSGNILIDLENTKPDGTPVVKLCDFDSAVPLRSWLHSCCIAHNGILPPNVCVGTPRWMAPEVYQAIDTPNLYGLEVDIWSFGCLLFEMLTLQLPYLELSESEINELLRKGERPQLTKELEDLVAPDESQSSEDPKKSEEETKILKFLVDIYCRCMKNNPVDRPTAETLYNLLAERVSSLTDTRSSEET